MKLGLESFPTEIFYEIFDYLTPYDVLRTFINLNHRLNTIIYSYPLELDFRFISRSKFNFVCRYVQPKQVISLILSDKNMPDQVQLFLNYFPDFAQTFHRLQTLKFIETETIFTISPFNISSISLINYKNNDYNEHNNKIQILLEQIKFLKYLQLDRSAPLLSMNLSSYRLTHLTINHCSIIELNFILHSNQLHITHLNISIINNNHQENELIPDLIQLSHCLNHLHISFSQQMNISFHLLEQCLLKIYRLTHLTIQANGSLDLLDGFRWKKFIQKTSIIKFNFEFIHISRTPIKPSKISILSSFETNFWLEQKQWYVACEQDVSNVIETSIYSIPYFRSQYIQYPSNTFPPFSTAPVNIERYLFYENKINQLVYNFNQLVSPPIHYFNQVNSLRVLNLSYPLVLLIETLFTTINFNYIKILDLSCVKNLISHRLQTILEHTPRLYRLIVFKWDSLCILPLHIHSLKISTTSLYECIDRACEYSSHIEHLEFQVKSIIIMIEWINRLNHLENIECRLVDNTELLTIDSKEWFQKNISRLKKKTNFTYRISLNSIYLSIDNDEQISTIDDTMSQNSDEIHTKFDCCKFRSKCLLL